MNTWFYLGVKLLHVLSMALWIGGSLVAVIGVRESLERGLDHARATSDRLQAITKLMVPSGLLTLVTGAGLIVLGGGFANMPPRILIGAALTVATFLIGATMANPALTRFKRAVEEEKDLAEAKVQIARFLKAVNLEQMLRLVVLMLMVFRFEL